MNMNISLKFVIPGHFDRLDSLVHHLFGQGQTFKTLILCHQERSMYKPRTFFRL